MKHSLFALLGLFNFSLLFAQQTTPLYLLFNSSCMDQLEYRQVYTGVANMGYSVHPTANEQYILMAGSGAINSPTLPKGTVNCREYALNEQFLNDVNNVSRQVYIVHQLTKGYSLTPVISATQVLRSGTFYLFRAPSYSFAVDTSNLVYEGNIATGSSDWYIYFNGLKIRGCYYEYSFKREPTRTNQERSEFDFVPGIGITTERTGMTAADAEANSNRLVRVNGMALEDYISMQCQQSATTAPGAAPLSKYTPQMNYGAMPVRESDKELGSASAAYGAATSTVGPPPLANCPEPPGEGYHIVQPGETLNAISRAYELPVRSLVSWNKIKDPDKILVCQKIWLKKPPAESATLASKGASPAAYSTPSGQAVIRQDIYWKNPAYQQPATYTYQPPQTYSTQSQTPPYTAPAQTLVHTVQKGETLYGIGQRYGVSEAEMRRINNLPAAGDVLLRPGTQLFVSDCCPETKTGTINYPSLDTQTQPQYTPPQGTQPQTYYNPPAGGTYLPDLYTNPSGTGQPQYNAPATYNTPTPTQPTTTTTQPTQPNQPAKTPTYFQEYIVREGDTINSIAIKFKVNAQELALVNNKEPNETLIAGQRLLIPRN